MTQSSPPSVVIASFRSPAEAEVARSAVEQAGIGVMLAVDQSVGVSVLVATEDADRALSVLEGLWPDSEAAQPIEPAFDLERCPECGSSVFLKIRRLPFFVAFSILMMALGLAVGQTDLFGLVVGIVAVLLFLGPNRSCLACGERWRSWSSAGVPPDELPVEPPDVVCPRCGSVETSLIDRRRQKAGTLLVNFLLPPLLLIWPFLPNRTCDECGHEWR